MTDKSQTDPCTARSDRILLNEIMCELLSPEPISNNYSGYISSSDLRFLILGNDAFLDTYKVFAYEADTIFETYVNLLKEHISLHRHPFEFSVYVTGSYARAEQTASSDLDLIVIQKYASETTDILEYWTHLITKMPFLSPHLLSTEAIEPVVSNLSLWFMKNDAIPLQCPPRSIEDILPLPRFTITGWDAVSLRKQELNAYRKKIKQSGRPGHEWLYGAGPMHDIQFAMAYSKLMLCCTTPDVSQQIHALEPYRVYLRALRLCFAEKWGINPGSFQQLLLSDGALDGMPSLFAREIISGVLNGLKSEIAKLLMMLMV